MIQSNVLCIANILRTKINTTAWYILLLQVMHLLHILNDLMEIDIANQDHEKL